MNYLIAQDIFKSAKNRSKGKPIANNTRIVETENGYGIKLHDTIVVDISPKYWTLYTGGWYTSTTKARINTYLPEKCSVYQENSQWYVTSNGYGLQSRFFEGIKVDDFGRVLNPEKTLKTEKIMKSQKDLKKKIKDYALKCDQLAVTQTLEKPSGGDCWYCAMATQEGENLGDKIKDYDHLAQHIKEKYFVPSLVYNAVKEAGYRDPAFIIWGYPTGGNVSRAVRKYLYKRLLPR
jgi:hypothetical protein